MSPCRARALPRFHDMQSARDALYRWTETPAWRSSLGRKITRDRLDFLVAEPQRHVLHHTIREYVDDFRMRELRQRFLGWRAPLPFTVACRASLLVHRFPQLQELRIPDRRCWWWWRRMCHK